MGFEVLGSLATIIMGQSPKKEEVNKIRNGLPLLNGPTEFGGYCPIPVQFTEYPKKIAPKGSLLFCVRGSTTGRMNWADQDYAIGRGLAAIIPSDSRIGEYLRNSINYNLEYLLSSATGSTFPNVSGSLLSSFPVQVVQNTVGASNLLDIIGKKILQNQHIIDNLEQLAQTLFKRWFVDFEFPNGNGEPYKSSGGEMVESELGMIPKGWMADEIGNLLELSYGKPLKKDNRVHGAYPVYGSNGIVDYHQESLVNGPGIIVGRKGTAGTVIYEQENFFPIDTTFFVTRKDESITWNYLYFMLLDQRLENLTGDSAVPGLNRNHVYKNKYVASDIELIIRFEEIIGSMLFNKSRLIKESESLKDLRDTLLPKLLSGEIEIPDENEVTEDVPIS